MIWESSNWVAERGWISKHEPRDQVTYQLVSPSCPGRGEGHSSTDLTSLLDEAKRKRGRSGNVRKGNQQDKGR